MFCLVGMLKFHSIGVLMMREVSLQMVMQPKCCEVNAGWDHTPTHICELWTRSFQGIAVRFWCLKCAVVVVHSRTGSSSRGLCMFCVELSAVTYDFHQVSALRVRKVHTLGADLRCGCSSAFCKRQGEVCLSSPRRVQPSVLGSWCDGLFALL